MRHKLSITLTFAATVILIVSGIAVFAHGPSYYSTEANKPDSQGTTTQVINVDTTLTENITAGNFTINSGVTLTTDGFSILCTGNFTNYGTILTGYSSIKNYPLSYGGSGGGAYQQGNSSLAGTTGFSTRVAGGNGNSKIGSTAGNGSTPVVPNLTRTSISSWYAAGIGNYLDGAAGETLHGYNNSAGANGLYIQARNIVNRGIINAMDPNPLQEVNGFYPGGGGGGVVLLAYGNSIISGVIQVSGQLGSYDSNLIHRGGSGGSGSVMDFNYGSEAPVTSFTPVRFVVPQWAFAGAYFNFSDIITWRGQPSFSYVLFQISAVNIQEQTFVYSSYAGTGRGPRISQEINQTNSFTSPVSFVAFSQEVLKQLENNVTTGFYSQVGMTFANETAVSTGISISVGAGTFKTIQVSIHKNLSYWIDMNTGILVKTTTTIPTGGNNNESVDLTLNATNVVSPAKSLDLYLIILPVIAGIIIVTISARLFRSSSESREKVYGNEEEFAEKTAIDRGVVESRLSELKSLLDKGLISQEYYADSVARLTADADHNEDTETE